MRQPWMPWRWCVVRTAFIITRKSGMGSDNVANAALCRTKTISAPTESGKKELTMELIDRDDLTADFMEGGIYPLFVRRRIENAPVVDAVPAEKYDALREAFIDYVCSGVSNPAPYCKNRCAECVNEYGWCRDKGENCAGFDPDKEG